MNNNISEHFTLKEFTVSSWAKNNDVENKPTEEIYDRLVYTAKNMEKVRAILDGKPIKINSGYRNPEVNKGIGGSKTSAHMLGYAIDFVCPNFGSPFEVCKQIAVSGITYDQLIQEGTWVHISFDPKARQQNLTKTSTGFKTGISK